MTGRSLAVAFARYLEGVSGQPGDGVDAGEVIVKIERRNTGEKRRNELFTRHEALLEVGH